MTNSNTRMPGKKSTEDEYCHGSANSQPYDDSFFAMLDTKICCEYPIRHTRIEFNSGN